MKKYNLSKIMKKAWEYVKKLKMTISSGLKRAWREAKMELKELTGTQKQVKWANDIRQKMLEVCDKNDFKLVKRSALNRTTAEWFIENCKIMTSKYRSEEDKRWFLKHEELHLEFYYAEEIDITRNKQGYLDYYKENDYDIEVINDGLITVSKIW